MGGDDGKLTKEEAAIYDRAVESFRKETHSSGFTETRSNGSAPLLSSNEAEKKEATIIEMDLLNRTGHGAELGSLIKLREEIETKVPIPIGRELEHMDMHAWKAYLDKNNFVDRAILHPEKSDELDKLTDKLTAFTATIDGIEKASPNAKLFEVLHKVEQNGRVLVPNTDPIDVSFITNFAPDIVSGVVAHGTGKKHKKHEISITGSMPFKVVDDSDKGKAEIYEESKLLGLQMALAEKAGIKGFKKEEGPSYNVNIDRTTVSYNYTWDDRSLSPKDVADKLKHASQEVLKMNPQEQEKFIQRAEVLRVQLEEKSGAKEKSLSYQNADEGQLQSPGRSGKKPIVAANTKKNGL